MGKGKGEGRYIFRRLERGAQSYMRHTVESGYWEEWDSIGFGGCMENRNEFYRNAGASWNGNVVETGRISRTGLTHPLWSQGTPCTSRQLIAGPTLMSNVGFSILLKDTSTCPATF